MHEKLKTPQFHMMKVPKTTLELKYVIQRIGIAGGSIRKRSTHRRIDDDQPTHTTLD